MAFPACVSICLWLFLMLLSNAIFANIPMKNTSLLNSMEKQQTRKLCSISAAVMDYTITCYVPSINDNLDLSVYSGISSFIKIYCDKQVVLPSRLSDGLFEPLGNTLLEVEINDCYFINISREAFRGLKRLRTLWVKSAIHFQTETYDLYLANVSNKMELALAPSRSTCSHDGIFLPEDIFDELITLVDLKLDGMHLNNSVWHKIVVLKNLQFLFLSNNFITTVNISSIGKLKNLVGLFLGENYIQNLLNGTFESLSLLTWLDLSRNRIRFIERDAFKGLSKLDTLDLSGNSIRTVEPDIFEGLVKLSKLNLTKNRIKKIARRFFSQITTLSEINLSYNRIDTLPEFSSSLFLIDISKNNIANIDNSSFAFSHHLNELYLSNNNIKYIARGAFEGLGELYVLDLSQNRIKAIGKYICKGLGGLYRLDLSQNNIENIEPDTFKELDKLDTLKLSHNSVRTVKTDTFKGLNRLRRLYLSDNQVKIIAHKALSKLTSLTILDVSYNRIETLPIIPSSVTYIDLSYNNITDLGSRSFAELPDLSNVNLGFNSLTRLQENAFKSNYKLQSLDLSFNQLVQLPIFPRLLHSLNLRNNNIVDLSGSSFVGLSYLSKLDLSHNRIQNWGLYSISQNIRILDLSSNDLSVVSLNVTGKLRYADLRNNHLASLEIGGLAEYQYTNGSGQFYLAGNRNLFHCVCNLEIFDKNKSLKYNSRSNALYRIWNFTSLVCSSMNNFETGGTTEIHTGTFLCDMPCYDNCTCYHWRYNTDNINIVNCLTAGLTTVPVNISGSCTILDLSGNTFYSLRPGNFDGLYHLTELYLNSSNITEIHEGIFRELSNLTKLDLSNNSILHLNSGIFKGLLRLYFLDLSSNKISIIVENTFKSLIKLKDLDLSRNELETISSYDIKSLYKLASLKLSHNSWSCDCTFLDIFIALTSKPFIRDQNYIICLTSNKTKHHITQIYMKEFCPYKSDNPDIITISISTAVGVLSVTIIIVIIWFKNRKFLKVCCFVNFGWMFGSRDNEQDRPYDAFVSFSGKDDAFIIRELMPRLEGPRRGQQGYRLCVHFRDFPVGESIAEAILDAVKNSRRTIMILSDNFLKSEWCHFEFQAAHHQVLKERKNRIIMVLLHDINTNLLDEHLKMFLSTRTYVKYGDPLFWNKIEYAMPKRKLLNEDNLNNDNNDDQVYNLPAVIDEDPNDDIQLIS